jgi:hypothetical protein
MYVRRLANEKRSHVTYHKAGEFPIVITKRHGRTAKRYKVDEVLERLRLDD